MLFGAGVQLPRTSTTLGACGGAPCWPTWVVPHFIEWSLRVHPWPWVVAEVSCAGNRRQTHMKVGYKGGRTTGLCDAARLFAESNKARGCTVVCCLDSRGLVYFPVQGWLKGKMSVEHGVGSERRSCTIGEGALVDHESGRCEVCCCWTKRYTFQQMKILENPFLLIHELLQEGSARHTRAKSHICQTLDCA